MHEGENSFDAFGFLILRGLELSACMYPKEFWSVEIKAMLLK